MTSPFHESHEGEYEEQVRASRTFKERLTRLREAGASADLLVHLWRYGPDGGILTALEEPDNDEMRTGLIDIFNEAVAKVDREDV